MKTTQLKIELAGDEGCLQEMKDLYKMIASMGNLEGVSLMIVHGNEDNPGNHLMQVQAMVYRESKWEVK